MNILLVIRSEILAVIIICFLIVYSAICSRYREGKDPFRGFAIAALGHALMGLATEITVNSTTVPSFINDALHVLFFAFALMFSLEYFEYVLNLILPVNKSKKPVWAARILAATAIIIMVLSPIEYLEGVGTKYSAGTGPTMCYMLGFVLFLLSDVFMIIKRRDISKQLLYTLLPLSFLALSLMAIQIVVPEFLFTGDALAIVALGVFFSIENPIGKFHDRALIDQDAKIWNRNCYELDVSQVFSKKAEESNTKIVYVLGDINGLKNVNDRYGHVEGDRLIAEAARILIENMGGAYRVYRIGGDEFAAIYINQPNSTVEKEMAAVEEACKKSRISVSISMGYAVHRAGEKIEETGQRADLQMYEAKERYYAANGLERRA